MDGRWRYTVKSTWIASCNVNIPGHRALSINSTRLTADPGNQLSAPGYQTSMTVRVANVKEKPIISLPRCPMFSALANGAFKSRIIVATHVTMPLFLLITAATNRAALNQNAISLNDNCMVQIYYVCMMKFLAINNVMKRRHTMDHNCSLTRYTKLDKRNFQNYFFGYYMQLMPRITYAD